MLTLRRGQDPALQMGSTFLTICGPDISGPYGVDDTFSCIPVGRRSHRDALRKTPALQTPANGILRFATPWPSGAQRGVSVDGAARWRPSGGRGMTPAGIPGRYLASGDSKGGNPLWSWVRCMRNQRDLFGSFSVTKRNGKKPNFRRKRQPTGPAAGRRGRRPLQTTREYHPAIRQGQDPALQTGDTFLTICGPDVSGPYGVAVNVPYPHRAAAPLPPRQGQASLCILPQPFPRCEPPGREPSCAA